MENIKTNLEAVERPITIDVSEEMLQLGVNSSLRQIVITLLNSINTSSLAGITLFRTSLDENQDLQLDITAVPAIYHQQINPREFKFVSKLAQGEECTTVTFGNAINSSQLSSIEISTKEKHALTDKDYQHIPNLQQQLNQICQSVIDSTLTQTSQPRLKSTIEAPKSIQSIITKLKRSFSATGYFVRLRFSIYPCTYQIKAYFDPTLNNPAFQAKRCGYVDSSTANNDANTTPQPPA